jgi:hypothetical protein
MCQTPIDEQAKQIVSDTLLRGSNGEASSREIAIALEANQSYIDYLDWLKDNMPPIDESVTIDVEGTRIKFQNADDFSDWLAERIT